MKLKLALLATALAVSGTALAADKRSSISVFGNITVPDEGDNSGYVALTYGYLLTSAIELEAGMSQFYAGGDTFTTINGGAKYYFGAVGKAGGIVPYVKAQVGRSTNTNAFSPDYTQYGGGGGVEFVLTEATSTFIEGVYLSTKYDTIRSNGFTFGGNTSSQIQFNVGIKLRF